MSSDGMGDPNDAELARARRYYDAFAATYEARRDGRSRYHDLLDDLEVDLAAPYVRDRELLEVGCGTGLVLRRLASIARSAVGVDLSPAMLAHARARGLDVREGDARALPFDDASFDVVVSFKTLPHVDDLRRALAEMARVLRPTRDARMIIELYNPNSVRALLKRVLPPARVAEGTERDVHTRFDDRWALQRAMPSGFAVERVRGIRTLTPAARLLDLAGVGQLFVAAERALADTHFAARFAGFSCFVLRRDDRR